jgi:hypothetical protein
MLFYSSPVSEAEDNSFVQWEDFIIVSTVFSHLPLSDQKHLGGRFFDEHS